MELNIFVFKIIFYSVLTAPYPQHTKPLVLKNKKGEYLKFVCIYSVFIYIKTFYSTCRKPGDMRLTHSFPALFRGLPRKLPGSAHTAGTSRLGHAFLARLIIPMSFRSAWLARYWTLNMLRPLDLPLPYLSLCSHTYFCVCEHCRQEFPADRAGGKTSEL